MAHTRNVFTYDDIGQLTDADASARGDEAYAYDPSGNRVGPQNTVGINNQLLADDTFDYEYDAEGNLVSKTERSTGEVTEYTYDHLNRMTSVTVSSAGGVILSESSYVYDVFNRRIRVDVDSDGDGPLAAETTFTVYDGDHAWADFDATGSVLARYLFGTRTDEIIARWRPTEGTAWYLTDHLGSIRNIANSVGQNINTILYDSFGNVLSESNPLVGDRFKFTGREYDSQTGLYYYRARFFDPATGRFTSQDPMHFAAEDLNLYRYGFNSPHSGTDPSGNIWVVQTVIGMTVGGAVGGLVGFATGVWCEYWLQWAGNPKVLDDGTILVEDSQFDWDKIIEAGEEAAGIGLAFGAVIGAGFGMMAAAFPTSTAWLPAVGALGGAGLGIYSIFARQDTINALWDGREEHPQALFGQMMCIFGEFAIGELGGLAGGALAQRALRSPKLRGSVKRFLDDETWNISIWNSR